jgi:imidazolonepropionase
MSPLSRPILFRNARLATLQQGLPGLGVIEKAALLTTPEGKIAFVGPEADVPISLIGEALAQDCEGRWITPGLIDCHTHLVHAGHRAAEFEMRLNGASYEAVARAGGGIVSSVKALRAASEAQLLAQTLPRLDALIAEGLTTIEIKSGYGLDLENERKTLRVARALARHRSVAVSTTFLGAHALPPEADGNKDAYIDAVIAMLAPLQDEGLIDAVDGFCEAIAFSPAQIERLFSAARAKNLPVKLHADQLSNLGGAALAARYHALSADHLEFTDEAGVAAMAQSGTVAGILPGAFYFIRETQKPPIDLFRKHKVPMALATDCNPGTAPLTSLLLTMNLAATLFRMSVDECLAGITREGARALGLLQQTGTLEVGKWADLALWDIDSPAELVYRMGQNPLFARIFRGQGPDDHT